MVGTPTAILNLVLTLRASRQDVVELGVLGQELGLGGLALGQQLLLLHFGLDWLGSLLRSKI